VLDLVIFGDARENGGDRDGEKGGYAALGRVGEELCGEGGEVGARENLRLGRRGNGAFCVRMAPAGNGDKLESPHVDSYKRLMDVRGDAGVVCEKTHSLQHQGVALKLRARIRQRLSSCLESGST
jgi:hypothetical protein